jgi:glutamate synthase (NADPH/NADH) large chain
VLPVPENKIVRKWRLQPGKMFLIDLEQGRMIDDEELKANLANTKPYKQWIENLRIKLDDALTLAASGPPSRPPVSPWCCCRRTAARSPAGLWLHQEDIKFLMAPWP